MKRSRLEVLKSWEPIQVIVLPRPEQLFSILIIFEHISVLTEIEVLERGGRMLRKQLDELLGSSEIAVLQFHSLKPTCNGRHYQAGRHLGQNGW